MLKYRNGAPEASEAPTVPALIDDDEDDTCKTLLPVKDVKAATERETAMTSRWRDDLRRGFREALELANYCVAFGQQAHGEFSPELEQQMREALEPLRRQLPEAKKKAQGLVDYFDRIETILSNAPVVLAEAVE